MKKKLSTSLITFVLLPVCLVPVAPSWATAATIVQVNTVKDVVDPNDGLTSLREAMNLINASDEEGNILLQIGKEYRLSICAPSDDDANRNGDLDHLSNGILTLSGNKASIRQTCPGARVIDQFGRGLLNLNDVTITGGDAATEPGGGVFVRGLGGLDVKNSNIYGNKSAGAGGGIASQGDVRLTGSNIALNFAKELAGGVASFTNLTLVNSSVTGNTVSAQSRIGIGGIAAEHQIVLIYSTVQDNTAPNLDVRSGTLRSFGSVVAAPRNDGPACGTIGKGTESWGYNFSDDDSCGFGNGTGDRVNAGSPMLGPRQGQGIVPLVYPLAGSPLLDAIPKSDCLPSQVPADVVPAWANLGVDITGTARPQSSGCDIGAAELAPEPAGKTRSGTATKEAAKNPVFTKETTTEQSGSQLRLSQGVPLWLTALIAALAMLLGIILGRNSTR